MDIVTHIVVWLNAAGNALGEAFFFIGFMPGWLSATIIAAFSGMAMLVAFKYTSHQRAIKRARQEIRANLLAVKLFHDSLLVGFQALGRVLLAAGRLLLLAIVPVLAMLVPTSLLLGQLALWYQARPLRMSEEAVIVLKLRGDPETAWPAVSLEPNDAIEDLAGAVHVYSQREVCWNVRGRKVGTHRLVFRVGNDRVEKELVVGDGWMRVSQRRPDHDWSDALLHPREIPFGPESAVQSIEVQYPARSSWTSGADYWFLYWLAVAFVTGFCCRGLFKVNL